MATYFYDPVLGSDSNDGLSKDAPKRNPTAFTLSSGQNQLLQAADTTWHATKVEGGAALQIGVSGAGVGQEFVVGVYQPLTGAQIRGELGRAAIDASGSDLGVNFPGAQSHHVIEGLEVYNVRRTSLNTAGIYHGAGAGSNITVRWCRVRDCVDSAGLGSGIKIQCDRGTVADCELTDNSSDNIFFAGDGHRILRNRVIVPANADGGADCIQGGGAATTNFEIADNYLDHRAVNAKQGIIVQDTSVSSLAFNKIARNIILGASPDLPLLSANEMKMIYIGAANVVVEGNIIYGGEYAVFCASASGSETSVGVMVVGNLVIQDHIKQTIGISLGATGYSKAYNNTVIHLLNDLVNTNTGITQFTGSSDIDIANNIVVGYQRGVRSVLYGADNVRNNCLYGNGTPLVDNGLTSRTPDASNIQVDPLLDSGYRPRSGSPVIGAGTYLASSRHMGGKRMSPVSPDIGAYQYTDPRAIVLTRAT